MFPARCYACRDRGASAGCLGPGRHRFTGVPRFHAGFLRLHRMHDGRAERGRAVICVIGLYSGSRQAARRRADVDAVRANAENAAWLLRSAMAESDARESPTAELEIERRADAVAAVEGDRPSLQRAFASYSPTREIALRATELGRPDAGIRRARSCIKFRCRLTRKRERGWITGCSGCCIHATQLAAVGPDSSGS